MKWLRVLLCVFFGTVLALLPSVGRTAESRVWLVKDSFDPLADLLEPYAPDQITRLNPNQLGHKLPGLNGLVFVFGTQARPYQRDASPASYRPLYTATVVIAVKRDGPHAETITGWHTLLDSEATVLVPDQGTEYGRLTAIALSRGLGAQEGDLAPALDAFRSLARQGRLNPANEYASSEYRNMYQPHRPADFDTVILWDYQARNLPGGTDRWKIIVPADGALSVDCGYVLNGTAKSSKRLQPLLDFLDSEHGREALVAAGFSPFANMTDISAWDGARLTYNPSYRRIVRQVKLYSPASVLERLLLKSMTLLLFCIAAWRILHRVPPGLRRMTSITALLFVLFWMLAGILKAISLDVNLARFFWFATYLSRHGLPVLWYCMCHVNLYDRLPSTRKLAVYGLIAAVLTGLVMTNDMHNLVFVYALPDPNTWEHQYSNNWGYYLSLFWSFSLSCAGLLLLLREKRTRQQKRQYLYAGLFFLFLFAYQLTYIAGMENIIDLDIPTTVAIMVLVFIFAAQKERFMGALLLALPTLQNTPHAIAVYDQYGQKIYANAVMESTVKDQYSICCGEGTEISCGDSHFKPHVYPLDQGQVLILEDITGLRQLEQSLAESHKKLNAVRKLLINRTEEAPTSAGIQEQERYYRQIDQLLQKKLDAVRQELVCLSASSEGQTDSLRQKLIHVRYLIFICQHRLRFIIRCLEAHPGPPVELAESYMAGVIRSGQSLGLDGVFTTDGRGDCPPGIIPAMLEIVDAICLHALKWPGLSLICHLEKADDIMFIARLSWEDIEPSIQQELLHTLLTEQCCSIMADAGGQISKEAAEDGFSLKIRFPGREAAT